jgi:hypothetical protein
MIFLIIALALLALFAFSYFGKLKLHIVLHIGPENKYIALYLSAAFIPLNEYLFSIRKREGGLFRLKLYKKGALQDILELRDLIETVKRERPKRAKELTEILDMFLDKRKMEIETLAVKVHVGLEDAMQAAMLHGAVTSLLNTALAKLYRVKGIPKETKIGIVPYFDKQVFEVYADSLLSVKICYVLIAGVKILLEKSREKRSEKYRAVGKGQAA